ncbi:sugar-binding protein [Candidatus Sumerlaeota bacterium]|nr:sugar-binding protein [Candidatus Sumerlaeota bacterium]
MKQRMIHLTMVCILAAMVFSNGRQAMGQEEAAKEPAKKLTLAFVTNNAANFWTIAQRGCEKAEAELENVKLEFRIPSEGSATQQKQYLDDLLAMGIDGIAVSPIDPENQTDMLNMIASQTLLICHDSDAPKSNRACYVGTDNVAAGREAGKLIKECLPEGGKIMVFVGKIDAQNAKERFQGIKEAIEGSNVEIIDVRTDDTDTVRAKKNVEDALVKYDDLACLVGLWSYNGPAIYNAVKEKGLAGKVQIVCFDEEEEVLMGVEEGTIYGTVVQQPFEFGYQAITRMANHLRGDADAIPEGKIVIIPTKNIMKDNVAEFSAQLKEMLGK